MMSTHLYSLLFCLSLSVPHTLLHFSTVNILLVLSFCYSLSHAIVCSRFDFKLTCFCAANTLRFYYCRDFVSVHWTIAVCTHSEFCFLLFSIKYCNWFSLFKRKEIFLCRIWKKKWRENILGNIWISKWKSTEFGQCYDNDKNSHRIDANKKHSSIAENDEFFSYGFQTHNETESPGFRGRFNHCE